VHKHHPEAPIHPDLFQEMRTTVRWCITGLAGSTGLAGGIALMARSTDQRAQGGGRAGLSSTGSATREADDA
jgi:hypothetical protein